MFEILSNYGITPTVLQLAVVAGFVVFLIGMFWKQIVIGFGIVTAVYIFTASPISNVKEVATNDVVSVKHDAVEEKDNTPKEYIQDCMRFTSKSEFDCRILWNEREDNAN